MRGPAEDALTAAATARVDALMQRRLVHAVCTPVGIEHLEDRRALDQLASAQGELIGGQPAGAPIALVSQLGDRLTGVLACVVLATFRWWLGAGLLAVWLAVRSPLAASLRYQSRRIRGAAEPLRRSWYLLGLAWKPPAAKEVRVFGLGDWVADRHREEWLEGIQPAWGEMRRMQIRALIAGAAVLAAYALAAGTLGYAAYHDEISLRTLATMLPMLPTSMSAGSISYGDINLEKLLSAVPDLDALTGTLAREGAIALRRRARGGAAARRRAVRTARLHIPRSDRARAARRRARAPSWAVARAGRGQRRRQDHARDVARADARADRRADHGRRRAARHPRRAQLAAPGRGRLSGLRAAPADSRPRTSRLDARRAAAERGAARPGRGPGRGVGDHRVASARLEHGAVSALRRRRRSVGRAVAASRAGARPDARGTAARSCSTSRPRASTPQPRARCSRVTRQPRERSPTAYGTITLLVSHRFSTVRTADLIIVLERWPRARGALAPAVDGRRRDVRGAVRAAGARVRLRRRRGPGGGSSRPAGCDRRPGCR